MRCCPWDQSVPRWALVLSTAVIAGWCAAGVVFVHTAPAFLSDTGAHLDPPSNSRGILADKIVAEFFPYNPLTCVPSMYLLVQSGSDVRANSGIREYTAWVQDNLHSQTLNESVGPTLDGYFLPRPHTLVSTDWMVSPDKLSTIISIYTHYNATAYVKGFVDFMQGYVADPLKSGVTNCDTFTVVLGGYDLTTSDTKVVASLKRMEMIVLPLAFSILAYFIRRVQLLLITLCCMALALGTAFSVADPIARHWGNVSGDTPEMMTSVAVALSIDYSLFLLTRFLEGQQRGLTQWESIRDMVRHTGHTIGISSVLIALAFASSLLMPVETIRTAGILTAATAAVTFVVNITAVPALLTLFGRALMANPFARCMRCCKRSDSTIVLELSDSDDESPCLGDDAATEAGNATDSEVWKGTGDDPHLERCRATVWYRLADFTRRHATAVIIVVLIAGAPLIAQLPYLKVSIDRNLGTVRTAESMRTMRLLEEAGIEAGRINPSCIAITGLPMSNFNMTRDQFELVGALGDALYTTFDSDVQRDVIMSPVHFNGVRLTFEEAHELLVRSFLPSAPIEALEYRQDFEQTVGHNAVMIIVYTPFRTFGPKGGDWVRNARRLIDNFNEKHAGSQKAYVVAPNAPDLDAANIVESHIPVIIGAICIAVMVIVGLVFQSLLLPLRLAFALGYTIAVTLGMAVVVYQTKAFWWMFPYLRNFEDEGLAYAIPAVVIPVCIALGLDYDIFLLTRVMEYRQAGMADDEAVVMGVASTGATISGAGLIMSIAFGGLLMSDEVQLNQFGFLLTFSVLLDTFVIRTIFVPALMLKAAKYNWWPRRMPPVTKQLSDPPQHHVQDSDDEVDENAPLVTC